MVAAPGGAELGMGCVKLGSAAAGGPRAGVRLVHAACDRGVRFFDTADAYGSGASERVLGSALRGARRDRVTVATKCGYVFRERTTAELLARRAAAPLLARVSAARPGGGAHAAVTSVAGNAYDAQDFTPAHIRAAVDASLRRLRTDRIDLCQLHGPRSVCSDDTLAALEDLRTAGKILAFGVGLESLDHASAWIDVPGISSVQLPFGVLDPEAGHALLPAAQARGVGVIARGVFAAGLLGDLAPSTEAAMAPRQRALRVAVRDAARDHGIDPLGAAAWFVRSRPGVTTVLLGMSSLAHLDDNLRHFAAAEPPRSFVEALDRALTSYLGASEPPTR